jgi:hypothetical protein
MCPRKRLQKITAWSYSRLSEYCRCPFSAKLKFLDRIKEPQNAAMARGQSIHEKAGVFIKGRSKKTPEELERFTDEFAHLRHIKKSVAIELELAVRADWSVCDWFAKDAWLRAKLDTAYVMDDSWKIIDFKTGKVRPENVEQLDLYAAVAIAHAPDHVQVIDAELWYLDWGEIIRRTYSRADALRLQKKYKKDKAVLKMLSDTTFKPTPGNHCRWCYFGQAKKEEGPGLCKY